MIKLFSLSSSLIQHRFNRHAILLFNILAISFLLIVLVFLSVKPAYTANANTPQALTNSVDCGLTTYSVDTEADFNAALDCYNTAVNGDYQINIGGDITLTGDSTVINHSQDATLEILGNGFTLDGGYIYRILEIKDGQITISSITLTHGVAPYYSSGGAITVDYDGGHDHCNEEGNEICYPDLSEAPQVLMTNTAVINNYGTGGGGISVQNGRVTIANSLIADNIVNHNSYRGGGIYNSGGAVTIIDSEISNNNGKKNGGGIYSSGGPFTMTGTTIQYNTSDNQGGALIGYGEGFLIQDNLFYSNTVIGESGGLGLYYANDVQVLDNTFQENSAKWSGGGMYISFGDNFEIKGNTFISNSGGSGSGGGYYSRYITNAEIKNNTFTHNTATSGGALKIYADDDTWDEIEQVQFTGNLLQQNRATNGGGIYIDGPGESYLTNNTITENDATNNGSGVFVEIGATAFIEHDTIVSNTTSLTVSAVYIEANGTSTATATVKNSIIAYGSYDVCNGPFTDNGGNITSDSSCTLTSATSLADTDPLLLPLADNGGDTHTLAITEDSPALDLADTSSVAIDQRGVTRPQREGYDSGAYELEASNTISVTTDPAVDTTLSFTPTNGTTPTVTTIEIPAGAVSETVTIVYTHLEDEAADDTYVFAGTRFEITAYIDGEAQESYKLVEPANVKIKYDESQLDGFTEETLILLAQSGSEWVDAAATCYGDDLSMVPNDAYDRDLDNNLISVPICSLTQFALFGGTSTFDIYIPVIVSE